MIKKPCDGCGKTFAQSGVYEISEADPFCSECDLIKPVVEPIRSELPPLKVATDGQIEFGFNLNWPTP